MGRDVAATGPHGQRAGTPPRRFGRRPVGFRLLLQANFRRLLLVFRVGVHHALPLDFAEHRNVGGDRFVVENVWGRDDLKFPSPLPESPMKFLGANVLPMEILVVVGAILMMLAVEFFNRKTIYGKAVVATFNDRDAAKLMGINTGLVITFSYALSSMTAGFAGVLIAPLTLTGATMGAVLGLKAFAVAIIGGLTSGMGIVVGGIILGVAETTTGFYLSTGYKDVPGLVLLLIVLAVRPQGLFGKSVIKKV